MTGVAQSNERVSELLRNLSNNSQWLERPELIEIKAGTVGQGKDIKRIFEFTINVGIKRQRDKDTDKDKSAAAAAAGKAASDAGGLGAAVNAPKKP